jgi:hypothetical protein
MYQGVKHDAYFKTMKAEHPYLDMKLFGHVDGGQPLQYRAWYYYLQYFKISHSNSGGVESPPGEGGGGGQQVTID